MKSDGGCDLRGYTLVWWGIREKGKARFKRKKSKKKMQEKKVKKNRQEREKDIKSGFRYSSRRYKYL